MTSTPDAAKRNIVIIGGGIIGCTTAYFLTRHPKFNPSLHTITLLEATSIASGASGKAGGLLALWAYPSCIVPLSFRLHAELAKEHNGAARWGYRRLGVGQLEAKGRKTDSSKPAASRAKVPDHNIPANSKDTTNGSISGLHTQSGTIDGNISLQKRSTESYALLRKAGLPQDLDWFADESVIAYDTMGTPENTAQVHPYQFTTSMAELAREQGVAVILGHVDSIQHSKSSGVESVTYTDKHSQEQKTVSATDVVITAGPWTCTIWPGAPIGALRAHSVTIRPSQPVSAYAIFTNISLPKDSKTGTKSRAQHVTPELYARPNNEVYACGEGDHTVPLPRTSDKVECDESKCQDIVDYAASISDEMRDGEVLVRQACYLPQVETGGGPLVGPTGVEGVWMAAGHTCWGIQNGPGTGKVMSELVLDGKATSANVGSLDPRRALR